MKKVLDKTQKKNLYYVVGVVVLALVYALGFRNLQTLVADKQETVTELEAENERRLSMKENQAENEKKMAEMQKKMDKILEAFPTDVKEDDAILFANDIEQEQGMQFAATYFGQSNLEEAGQTSGYSMSVRPVQYSFSAGYEQLKNVMRRIEADETKGLSSLTIGYDMNTGNLQGDMTVNFYSIEGGDRTYKATDNPGISQGNLNPFATAE